MWPMEGKTMTLETEEIVQNMNNYNNQYKNPVDQI